MNTPSAPATPDPVATASAQGQANAGTATAQTALNNANVISPLGTSTWNQTGWQKYTNPDGSISRVPTYTNTQTLSPEQQKLYDQQTALGSQQNQIAGRALHSVDASLSHPLSQDDYARLSGVGNGPAMNAGYDSGGDLADSYATVNPVTGYASGGPISNGYDAGGNIQGSVGYDLAGTSANQNTNSPTSFGAAGPIQGSVNLDRTATQFGGAGPIQRGLNTDFSGQANKLTQSVLDRLKPGMDQQSSALASQLANQGVVQGSAAWNAAMLSDSQRNNDLRLGAVATGDTEQQALFGQSATAGNFANSAQAQDFGQQQARGMFSQAGTAANNAAAMNAGNFANAAQAQDYGQQQGRGLFAQGGIAANNAAAMNEAGYGLSATGANNAARLNAGNFANAAQSQGNSQNAGAAQFANNAQAQRESENAAASGFYNQGALQYGEQNAAQAGFGNQTQAQRESENAAQAAFNNSARQQQYQNRVNATGFNNGVIGQQMQQDMALQQAPINEVSALMHGGQASMPSFSQYNPGTVGQTPISQDTYNSANLAQQQYQAQMGYAGQTNAGLFGLGASAAGGLFKMSDRRVKRDVRRIGSLSNGLPVYAFRYLWSDEPELGLMAQDVLAVRPDAIASNDNGVLLVDYVKASAA